MSCYRLDLEASGLTYPLPRTAKSPLFRYFDPGAVAVALMLYRDGTVIESRGPDIADTLACDRFLNNGGTFATGDWEIDVLADAGYVLVPCGEPTASGPFPSGSTFPGPSTFPGGGSNGYALYPGDIYPGDSLPGGS